MAGTSQKTTTVGVRVPNEVLALWRVKAQQAGQAVSAYLLGLAQSNGVAPRPSIDHGIIRTADLTMPARSPAIVSQSRFAGGQVDVTLAIPLAVMASTPLAKLEEADKLRAIEDEVNQRFLYRKVVRVK
jgi:hypothetical protein